MGTMEGRFFGPVAVLESAVLVVPVLSVVAPPVVDAGLDGASFPPAAEGSSHLVAPSAVMSAAIATIVAGNWRLVVTMQWPGCDEFQRSLGNREHREAEVAVQCLAGPGTCVYGREEGRCQLTVPITPVLCSG